MIRRCKCGKFSGGNAVECKYCREATLQTMAIRELKIINQELLEENSRMKFIITILLVVYVVTWLFTWI